MNILFINKKSIIKSMSLLILLIYIVFLYIDIHSYNLGSIYSIQLKYFSIVLCFIISMFIGSEGNNREDKFSLQAARLFTVIADYFLVIEGKNKYGILYFCIVQVIYIARHSRITKVNIYKAFLTASIGMTVLIAFLYKIDAEAFKIEFMLEGAVYGCILFVSLYIALKTKKTLISLGMLLFFICDMNVGLYNFTNEFIIGFLIWLFYLPSQLLLSLSGYKTEYLRLVFKG